MQPNIAPASGEVRASQVSAPKMPPASPPKSPFACDRMDALFAVLSFLFGYCYVWVFEKTMVYCGFWGSPFIALITVGYAAFVLTYLYLRGRRPGAESWFWLAVMLSLGLPVTLWSLAPMIQLALLHAVALYWTLSAAGVLYGGKTGNWLPFDCLSALLVVPVTNLPAAFRTLLAERSGSKARHKVGLILLGVCIAVPLLALILPLLASADQFFADGMRQTGTWLVNNCGNVLLRMILAVPVGAWVYGVCYGAARRVNTEPYNRDIVRQMAQKAHFVPVLAGVTALILVCTVYALFIVLQGGYLFSAFSGRLPASFSYAAYARQGFFELCRIGAINVCLLLVTHLFSRTESGKNTALRMSSIALSALSLLLCATAMSKMGLYIAAYGLTVKRIVATVFLIWLALVFLGAIIYQFNRFGIVRFAAFSGAALVCLLCVLPVERMIFSYNTAHSIASTVGFLLT